MVDLDRKPVQAAGAVLSIAALFWGFLQAPFLHIHAEETDHPATSPVHLHVHVAQRALGPALCAHTADDDAIDVEWRIAPPSAATYSLDLAVSGTVTVAAPP